MFRFARILPRAVLLAASLAVGAGSVAPAAGQSPDSVTLAPGPQYRADLPLSFLGSWVYGKRYRNAWTTPITVPRFNPSQFAGGLTPLFADTGIRAGSHYFRDGRGELWTFRTFDPNLLLALCAARVPGDTHRNLRVTAEWSGQTFKHVLMPVWLLTYDYGRKSYQCVMNGVTGRTEGEYPKSPWKIAALVLAVLVFLAVVASISGR